MGRRRSAVKRHSNVIVLGSLCVFALAGLSPSRGIAAAATDAEWPCQQRLVPTLTAGMMWHGPPIDNFGDWHADPRVADLVQRIAPRDVAVEQGEAAISEFVNRLGSDKARPVALAFSALLDETNSERAEVIKRIEEQGQRQRNLAILVDRLTTEIDTASEAAEEARNELQQRLTFTSRAYAEARRMMRYMCQVPVSLEARLGAYARALEAALR